MNEAKAQEYQGTWHQATPTPPTTTILVSGWCHTYWNISTELWDYLKDVNHNESESPIPW